MNAVYDGQMDPECVKLCDTLNSIPGIETFESCCGHNTNPYRIWFKANSLEAISPIVQELDSGGRWPWKVDVTWAGLIETGFVNFCLEGPVGAYKQANELADKLIYRVIVGY